MATAIYSAVIFSTRSVTVLRLYHTFLVLVHPCVLVGTLPWSYNCNVVHFCEPTTSSKQYHCCMGTKRTDCQSMWWPILHGILLRAPTAKSTKSDESGGNIQMQRMNI